jgi:enoyl-CoA hydratase/carnithine racemase
MHVDSRRDGSAVWRLRLERGSADDALLDPDGVARLAEALREAEAAPECRIIVLEGTPGSFCKGMDLAFAVAHPAEAREGVRGFARGLLALRESTRVVIAAVDAQVAGGGVGLAAAADIALATTASTFSLPELVLGLLPAVVLPVLLERMPPQKARAIALGGTVDARSAVRLGLIDRRVAGPAELDAAVRATIKHVLRCHPAAVAGLKRLSREQEALDLRRALDLGADRTAEILDDREALRHIGAFLGGESPPWWAVGGRRR